MGKFVTLFSITLALLASNAIFAYSNKIDSVLSRTLERDGRANIIVSMKSGTKDILNDLTQKSFSSRTERSQAVYDALTARARNSQSKILNFLAVPATKNAFKFGKIQSLWITNQVFIEVASREFIDVLASMDEISLIQEDEIVSLIEPIEEATSENSINAVYQWGISQIQAPEAWSLYGGTYGAGIIVAGVDTGVRYTHNILRNTYQDDNHGWFDAFDQSAIPHDNNGHGTHTIGTVVGM